MDNDKEELLHAGHHHGRHVPNTMSTSNPSSVAPGDDLEGGQGALREKGRPGRRGGGGGRKGGNGGAGAGEKGPRRSAAPAVRLVALMALLFSSSAGVAFFILPVVRGTDVTAGTDMVARIVVMVGSIMGLVYVLLHLAAARDDYRKQKHGAPLFYGNYLHAGALLIVRVGIPIRITGLVTTALVVSQIGIDFSGPFVLNSRQTTYINLLVAIVGFIANCVLLLCVELSSTPFATLLVSKRSFLASSGRPSVEDAVLVEKVVSQQQTPRKSMQQDQKHRPLNSLDRTHGTWPVQTYPAQTWPAQTWPNQTLPAQTRSVVPSVAYSTYSTQTGTSQGEEDGFRLVETSPGVAMRVAISELPVDPPPVQARWQNSNGLPSPVHMSWRPPSHDRKSLDAGLRQIPRQPVLAQDIPADVRAFPLDTRSPTLPDVFRTSLDGFSASSSSHKPATSSTSSVASPVRMSWAPSPRLYNPQEQLMQSFRKDVNSSRTPRRHTMVSPRSPFGTFGGGPQQAVAFPTSLSPMPPPAPALRLPPRLVQSVSRATNQTPSPRAMSLRSHPPFAAALVKLPPVGSAPPPASSRVSYAELPANPPMVPTSPPTVVPRPRTAPNPGREATDTTPNASPQKRQAIKRKPLHQRRTSASTLAERPKPATVEEVSGEEDERVSRPPVSLARSYRRAEREREASLRRAAHAAQSAQDVNNFSRPLPRPQSLATLHRRTLSGQGSVSSIDIFSGDVAV